VEFHEPDIAELARFIAVQSNRNVNKIENHLQWFVVENPARNTQHPIGWGIRTGAGDVAGCLLCIPQFFRFRQARVLLLGASLFYVDPSHRGSGGLIFLKYAQSGKQTALFCNSANPEAARLWKSFQATPIPNSDHELLGTIRWAPVLEEILHRRLGQTFVFLTAAKALSPLARVAKPLKLASSVSGELVRLTTAEQALELAMDQSTGFVTGERGLDFVRWRYFSGPDKTIGVYAFRSPRIRQPVLVTVNQRFRGYREQISALNVLDIFPRVSGEESLLIAAALLQQYRAEVDVIVLRNCDAETQQVFQRVGFVRRSFECFNGWVLDRHNLMPTQEWYFVPADCDWLI
jgi:hypothetical protein